SRRSRPTARSTRSRKNGSSTISRDRLLMASETARYEIGGYRPGALAAIVGLHAGYYARHWNFGLPFETKVGAELAEFLARHDPLRDLFLVGYADGDVVASVIIDQSGGSSRGAHLRWFIVSEGMQG